jgi:hypothetical protein
MKTLFELQQDYFALFELIEEAEGDITGQEAVFEELFADWEKDLSAKLEACGHVLDGLEGQEKLLAEAIKKLQAKKARYGRSADVLRDRIKLILERMDKQKVNAGVYTFSIQKNPVSVEVYEQHISHFPAEFVRITRDVPKTALKQYLTEQGETELKTDDGVVLCRLIQTTRLKVA